MDSDKISIGCRVVVTNLDNGKQLPEYTIVGSQEANVMERKVSEDSPFGKALMGTKAGDEITVEAPPGRYPLPGGQHRTITREENCTMAEQNTQQDLREILQIRRDKLKALQDAGMNPFEITRYDVTHHAQEVKDNFDALEGQTVSLGGR